MEIDLREFYQQGMGLFGRLTGFADDQLIFDADLAQNLDKADAAALKIRTMIDHWIDKHDIDAPTEADYQPPWTHTPIIPRPSISARLVQRFGALASAPISTLSNSQYSMNVAFPSTNAA